MTDTNLAAISNQYNIGVSCKDQIITFNKNTQFSDGMATPMSVFSIADVTYDPSIHGSILRCSIANNSVNINLGDLNDGQQVIIFRSDSHATNVLTITGTQTTTLNLYKNNNTIVTTNPINPVALGFWFCVYEKSTKKWHIVRQCFT